VEHKNNNLPLILKVQEIIFFAWGKTHNRALCVLPAKKKIISALSESAV
jgi:hypothetical protein